MWEPSEGVDELDAVYELAVLPPDGIDKLCDVALSVGLEVTASVPDIIFWDDPDEPIFELPPLEEVFII